LRDSNIGEGNVAQLVHGVLECKRVFGHAL